MTDTQRISVIIPCYNGAAFLQEAIDSVLVQGHPDTEIVIVDDGSTDDSPKIAQEITTEINVSGYCSVKYIRQENQGPSAARNTGIHNATGEFIAFLDADDLYPDNKFKVQLAAFAENPDLDIVAGRIQYVTLEGAEEREVAYDDDNAVVHVHLGSMLTRRTVFDKIGVFDPSMRYSEDIEWWLRVRERPLNFIIMQDITLQYRLHGSNMTRGLTGINRPFMEAIRKSLERRRATGQMHIQPMSDQKQWEDE